MKGNKLLPVLILLITLSACVDSFQLEENLPPVLPVVYNTFEEEEELPEPLTPAENAALRLSMRTPVTLNPLLNEDITVARVLQLLFEPLLMLDDNLVPVPNLAELELSLDGTNVLITLRDSLYWSDFSPVTADDIIFSLETLRRAPAGAIYRDRIENITSFEMLNERTVRVHFNHIMSGAEYLFNFPIIPRHHFGGGAAANALQPLGNGPFMFGSLDAERLLLTVNPVSKRSRPLIENVEVMISPDAATDLHSFDRGLTDIYLSEVTLWARHNSIRPVRFSETAAMNYDFIGFNFARELPGNINFRRGLKYALDKEQIISDIFLTHAVHTTGFVHPFSPLYEPQPSGYNPANAALLIGRVRALAPRGEYGEILPLDILVSECNTEGVRIAGIAAETIKALGLHAQVTALPFDEYLRRLQNGEFDLVVGGYLLSFRPDISFALHSTGGDNIFSYHSEELDRLLEAAAIAVTENLHRRTMVDLQEYFAENLPLISLAFRHSAIVSDTRLHGINGNLAPSPDNIFARVEEWFVVN